MFLCFVKYQNESSLSFLSSERLWTVVGSNKSNRKQTGVGMSQRDSYTSTAAGSCDALSFTNTNNRFHHCCPCIACQQLPKQSCNGSKVQVKLTQHRNQISFAARPHENSSRPDFLSGATMHTDTEMDLMFYPTYQPTTHLPANNSLTSR